MKMTAQFSLDRKYRYTLERVWDETCDNRFVVIGLNPSTADEKVDDPTIRRCVSFAQSSAEQLNRRIGGLIMLNLFAYRSTDPRVLCRLPNEAAIGEGNDYWIDQSLRWPGLKLVVAAWGTRADNPSRINAIRRMIYFRSFKLWTFGLTKHGHPKHPLYLPSNTKLVEWPYDRR